MMKLDQTDKVILNILQENAKTSIKEIADKLNLSKTPIYERIKRLEENNIIQKYIAVVDHSLLERSMIVFCSVSLDVQKLKEIEEFKRKIYAIPEVLECYLMGGANDFLLKVMVKDLEAYHQFSSGTLAALDNVSQIKSTFVLNEVKKTFQPLISSDK